MARALIDEAERELVAAARNARLGRFQLEAAIQSVHAERAHSGRTDWRAIARFYDQLVQVAPSLGAAVGPCSGTCRGQWHAEAGLALLDEIDFGIGDLLSTVLGGARASAA